ncbi:hypothetical protein [Nocardia sp. NPDC051570]|uniref:hypothetical protein n=1 Tax=Nocardia sp. NPDC051570 TaxID=3364324 RepID=UPI0037BC1FB2
MLDEHCEHPGAAAVWLDLERCRPYFFTGEYEDLREYFVVDEDCVDELAWEPSEIIDLGTDPTTARA